MNSELSNIKCFIIHLQRANKRKKFVKEIINNVPIISEIINAVDGNSLSEKKINSILSNKKIYNPKYPFKLNPGEIGCFLSHREAWRRIVDQKLEAGLIIEDDVRVNPAIFNKSLNFTLKNIQKYKYIQFQVREIERKSAIIQTDNELKLLYPVPTQLRTSAQLVSFEAAVELLNKTEKIDRPVDTTLQMFWETKIKCYCVNKSGISDHTMEAGGSTLAQKNYSRIKLLKNIKRSVYRLKIFYLSKFQIQ
jgi:glycosyl transferase, family 25